MKIDYRQWEQNSSSIKIEGETIVIAPEDLIKDDGCELWTFDEAKKISTDLAGGWRLPNEKEMKKMSEGENILKENSSYWAGFVPSIFRTEYGVFATDDLRPFVGCRVRCVCNAESILN